MEQTELEKAARIVGNQLIGEGSDSFRPMAASLCNKLGNFLWDVLEGMTVEQAIEKSKNNELPL